RITPDDLKTGEGPKSLFRERWITPSEIARPSYEQIPDPDSLCIAFGAKVGEGKAQKRIRLEKNCLIAEYAFEGMAEGTFCIEINLAMPSCDGPAGRYRIGDDIMGGFGQDLTVQNLKSLILEDDVLGGKLTLRINHGMGCYARPHFSVSQSEAGFEKIMQAVTISLSCRPGELSGSVSIRFEVD
ncbi:MAG TPA: DUF1926 domain-containing protein, partial [Burkholderiales bacterium]|nr:DUF1926 domain-containing protein [Burkholderiales bacterium]